MAFLECTRCLSSENHWLRLVPGVFFFNLEVTLNVTAGLMLTNAIASTMCLLCVEATMSGGMLGVRAPVYSLCSPSLPLVLLLGMRPVPLFSCMGLLFTHRFPSLPLTALFWAPDSCGQGGSRRGAFGVGRGRGLTGRKEDPIQCSSCVAGGSSLYPCHFCKLPCFQRTLPKSVSYNSHLAFLTGGKKSPSGLEIWLL